MIPRTHDNTRLKARLAAAAGAAVITALLQVGIGLLFSAPAGAQAMQRVALVPGQTRPGAGGRFPALATATQYSRSA